MKTGTDTNLSLALMERLIEYRHQQPVYEEITKSTERSMLHTDVRVLVYHFARTGRGDILEIGSFIGGSTIAAALGARDSGLPRKIVSIEPGGQLKDHRLATRDIFKDLRKNLKRVGLLEAVTLINGLSFDEATIATVRERLRPGDTDLFVFDADSNPRRDIDCFGDLLAKGCWVVIDDYMGATDKTAPTRQQVDELVEEGRLEPVGLYGWGTWIGRWAG